MHPSGYTALSKMPSVKADLAVYCLVNSVSGWCMHAGVCMYRQNMEFQFLCVDGQFSKIQSQTRCLATNRLHDLPVRRYTTFLPPQETHRLP